MIIDDFRGEGKAINMKGKLVVSTVLLPIRLLP
jgi:hypothetical protein